jgi:hypothetical protein
MQTEERYREHDVRCQSLCTSKIVERDDDAEAICAWHHESHECTCAEIAEADAENEAQGIVDMLEGLGR